MRNTFPSHAAVTCLTSRVAQWTSHAPHSFEEACALRKDCKTGHCGGEHECEQQARLPPDGPPAGGDEAEPPCAGAVPHCHAGEQWPPDSKSVFRCPEPQCAHAAGQVQSLRYHYLRTHGTEVAALPAQCSEDHFISRFLHAHIIHRHTRIHFHIRTLM